MSAPQQQQIAANAILEKIPIQEPGDYDIVKTFSECMSQRLPHLTPFRSVCKDGPLSTVVAIVTAAPCSPALLHLGLLTALRAGNIDVVRYFLENGASMIRSTAEEVLKAPQDRWLPLFELIYQHGWTPNTRGHDGDVLLPRVVTDRSLLKWFLDHGADPNLDIQGPHPYRKGGPITNSCSALQAVAAKATVEAVQMLLDAGARIQNGAPLHYAAGASPVPIWQSDRMTLSKELDESKIPIMELLVASGANVNQLMDTPYQEPRSALLKAIRTGAVERVKWLLDHGANPFIQDLGSTPAICAARLGNANMRTAMERGIAARKWVTDATEETQSHT